MKYIKIINLIIFFIFFGLIINYYFSANFVSKKEKSRSDYNIFLTKYLDKIPKIKTEKDFKQFKDNSEYFKKDLEEKSFWQLLKNK
ncbi:MAG: hypothetical protein VW228_03650 [Pelagibacteraceae bacterium]